MAIMRQTACVFLTQSRLIALYSSFIARRRVGSQTPSQCRLLPFIRSLNLVLYHVRLFVVQLVVFFSLRPSCSKLTMALVNASLKLWSLNMAYMPLFFLKNVSSLCSRKRDSHFFFSQTICELDIVLTRTVKILITKELFKLTVLLTTGPYLPVSEVMVTCPYSCFITLIQWIYTCLFCAFFLTCFTDWVR